MKGKAYKASQVANYFLDLAKNESVDVSMLKLVKLSYIAHGWVLALSGRELIEESVEAWQYGPVIPSLYHEFKGCGRNPISRKATEVSFETFDFETPQISLSDKDTRQILSKVWDVYREVTGERLIDKTHQEGTPWSKHYKVGHRNIVIPNEEIREHYVSLLKKMVS